MTLRADDVYVSRVRSLEGCQHEATGPVNTCAGCGEELPPRYHTDDERHTVLDCLRVLNERVNALLDFHSRRT